MGGEGQPEKLKNKVDTYSRRIDEKNRLIYIAASDNYTIKSCKGHYEED
ncbi:MAG: type II toxin-antitoxin system YoeB family toxin [Selenomonadaceae bacterium]|nr:type II toxin-antitoxin system YoeB family toxin [Selenomonadaceae bacterium]